MSGKRPPLSLVPARGPLQLGSECEVLQPQVGWAFVEVAGFSGAPPGAGAPGGPDRKRPLAPPRTHLLVGLELLLPIAQHVLDEVLQLPRQLQVT